MSIKYIDSTEIYHLPFGQKIKITWSDIESYVGVVIKDYIHYEDGLKDEIRLIVEHMNRNMYVVQLI